MAGLLLSAGKKGRGHGCPALGQLVPCLVQCYQGRNRHWRLGAAETWSSRMDEGWVTTLLPTCHLILLYYYAEIKADVQIQKSSRGS